MILNLANSDSFCRHLIDFSLVEYENGEVESWFLGLPRSSHPAPLFPNARPLSSSFSWISLLFTDQQKCLDVLGIDKY